METYTEPPKSLSVAEREQLEYLKQLTGCSDEELGGIARNWARTEPQTDEEIREGVLHERYLRENFNADGTPIDNE